MPSYTEERSVPVNQRAYDKLSRARRKDESYSDVIIRLTSATLEGLQQDVMEGEVDGDTLIRAAQSCPYRAIRLKDMETGQVFS